MSPLSEYMNATGSDMYAALQHYRMTSHHDRMTADFQSSGGRSPLLVTTQCRQWRHFLLQYGMASMELQATLDYGPTASDHDSDFESSSGSSVDNDSGSDSEPEFQRAFPSPQEKIHNNENVDPKPKRAKLADWVLLDIFENERNALEAMGRFFSEGHTKGQSYTTKSTSVTVKEFRCALLTSQKCKAKAKLEFGSDCIMVKTLGDHSHDLALKPKLGIANHVKAFMAPYMELGIVRPKHLVRIMRDKQVTPMPTLKVSS